jgi:hypothetical protein
MHAFGGAERVSVEAAVEAVVVVVVVVMGHPGTNYQALWHQQRLQPLRRR